MNILLITGGLSSERKVSLMSSKEVLKVLKKNGYKTTVYDLKNGYLKIKKIVKDFDVLFPCLHGEEGEGGELHKYLKTLKKPIVGTTNYQGLKNAWYKIPFKKFCDKNKILTPKWKIIKNKKDILAFGFPCVLKASSGGSSKEVFILKTKKDLNNISLKFINFFVEEYIQGKEITVGVLDNQALPIIKIIPPKNEWFSYKNKYTRRTQEIINPKDINPLIKKQLQSITLNIHRSFNLGSYSRIDFILDNKNNPLVLEVNTIPGLTKNSLFPRMVKSTGLSFDGFVDLLIKLAIKDFKKIGK